MTVRAAAARALATVIKQESSLDSSLERQAKALKESDHALLRELCFGVCRHYFSLDSVLAKLLTKPLKTKDSDIKALLLIGLYQLVYLRVPDHAAINETVGAAKALKKIWAKNLVNGVLRQFLRDKDTLSEGLNNQSNHPKWLEQKITQAWPDSAADIFAANNQQGPLTLRINRRQGTREEYSNALERVGHKVHLCDFADHGLRLAEACDVTSLPGFAEGAFSVQDEAAQLSAHLLQLKPGQRVLDACCAPGGKTCHIAESEAELNELVALDRDAKRLERVSENLNRLGLQAKVLSADAQDLGAWWDEKLFDRILLDAPCSATGVIRRHPDIKLLRRDSDIAQLAQLQMHLLQSLWQTLAPGGLLLYATCSILPEENEYQVKSFVEQQPEAIHLAIDATWGDTRPFGRQLFPQTDSHDGFYYALLQKQT